MVGNKYDSHSRTIQNPVIGDRVSFINTARETNNEYTLVQVELAPKGGNPLHYHKTYSETFYVLKGNLGLQLGNQKMTLKEGESFAVKAFEIHKFFNPSDATPVIFDVKLEPGSSGFEKSLQVLYGLARDKKTNKKGIPKSLYDLSLFISWGDSHMPGILSLLEPLMSILAKKAVKKGRDQELIKKYCTI
ncbi:cupin domain-containing protein [Rhodocytophaga rosea]|uniref:Cupin domain-containing protein n=1 Tax=Rhodocytophaga rosea TaxID=2704465 RepID=A0A6C0GGR3_9BACT|nr:cupin domain-containing protein [Rhodocytophaga rosea]QHT66973.1 cupin domain-containing protein [Rhodocytophaga rosea]